MFRGDVFPLPPHTRCARRNLDGLGELGNGSKHLDGPIKVLHGSRICNHERDSTLNTNVMQEGGVITFVTKTPATLAERLKEARDDCGLSQQEVADKSGVAQTTIANLEAGTRQAPRKLLDIAKAVKVRAEWLEKGKLPKHETSVGASTSETDGAPAWPFSAELLQAVKALNADQLRIAENQLRAHLDLPVLGRPSGKRAANGA